MTRAYYIGCATAGSLLLLTIPLYVGIDHVAGRLPGPLGPTFAALATLHAVIVCGAIVCIGVALATRRSP